MKDSMGNGNKSITLFDVRVPMRDGVNLSANVYLPGDGEGKRYPVLMNRTPYVKDSASRSQVRTAARLFVDSGYAVVHMDVRGRGDSDGDFNPLFQEIEDGFDSFEWAGTQLWSTGSVGTWGGSYEGWVQILPMRLGSKYHRAAFLQCTPSMHPFHDCSAYTSGVPPLIMAMWTFFVHGRTLKEEINDRYFDWESMLNVRPLKDVMERLGLAGAAINSFLDHETYDDYCRRLWHESMIPSMNVPSYFVTGWFDDSLKGSLEHFPELTRKHPDELSRRNHRLLIGPWPHRLSSDSSKLGDFDYGPQSIVPLYNEAKLWFDYWLKGIDNGIMKEPAVRLFLMGENRWTDSPEFPLASAKRKEFLLAAEGPSNTLYGQGRLIGESETHISPSPKSSFVYNPEKPAPTPFWKDNFQNGTNEDIRYIQRRDDVLVFSSLPLEEPLDVIGMISAELFVSTTGVDTDFVARLSLVSPDGYAERLNHGIFRLRYREGYDRIKLVTPGEIVKISIDMWATGQRFKKGDCVRLDITSSAYPSWAPNYNTGKNVWEETKPIVATQTVYHSARHPSKLVLENVQDARFNDSWMVGHWNVQ